VLFGCGVGENDEVRGTLFRLPVKKEGVGHRPLISELESRSDEESDGEHTTHSYTHTIARLARLYRRCRTAVSFIFNQVQQLPSWSTKSYVLRIGSLIFKKCIVAFIGTIFVHFGFLFAIKNKR
jgi:hypothetical protein